MITKDDLISIRDRLLILEGDINVLSGIEEREGCGIQLKIISDCVNEAVMRTMDAIRLVSKKGGDKDV